jgi:hypothetical protein
MVPVSTPTRIGYQRRRRQPLAGRDGIASARQDGQDTVLEIGSGVYRFVW